MGDQFSTNILLYHTFSVLIMFQTAQVTFNALKVTSNDVDATAELLVIHKQLKSSTDK